MPMVMDRFDAPMPDEALNALADHCLAARALIDEHGSPVMARLIDLLLFEVGAAIADEVEDEAGERGGRA